MDLTVWTELWISSHRFEDLDVVNCEINGIF